MSGVLSKFIYMYVCGCVCVHRCPFRRQILAALFFSDLSLLAFAFLSYSKATSDQLHTSTYICIQCRDMACERNVVVSALLVHWSTGKQQKLEGQVAG